MTRQEFTERYNKAYKNALHSIDYAGLIQDRISDSSGNKLTISSETLAAFIVELSLKLNKEIMESVLAQLFEVDG